MSDDDDGYGHKWFLLQLLLLNVGAVFLLAGVAGLAWRFFKWVGGIE